MKTLKETKKKYKLTNAIIASFFSYKSQKSYENSLAKSKVDKAIVHLIELVEDYHLKEAEKKEKQISDIFNLSKQKGRKEILTELMEWIKKRE